MKNLHTMKNSVFTTPRFFSCDSYKKQLMLLPPPGGFLWFTVKLSLCLSVFAITPKVAHFYEFFIWAGPDQRKKVIKFLKDRMIFWIKKIPNVQKSHFVCIFNDFGYLFDITPTVMRAWS